jgi:hypothetical protein
MKQGALMARSSLLSLSLGLLQSLVDRAGEYTGSQRRALRITDSDSQ